MSLAKCSPTTFSYIKDNSSSINLEEEKIKEKVVGFFSNLISVHNSTPPAIFKQYQTLQSIISSIPDQQDNLFLLKTFTLEEIKKVVFSIHLEKALKQNVFIVLLYQKF